MLDPVLGTTHPESCKASEESPEQGGLAEDWQVWAEEENWVNWDGLVQRRGIQARLEEF